MKSTKHTPGPWSVETEDGSTNIVWQGPKYPKRIATVGNARFLGEEEEANAALVASAPEMLALLERLLHAHHQLNTGEVFERTVRQVAHEARIVVAKAKGGR